MLGESVGQNGRPSGGGRNLRPPRLSPARSIETWSPAENGRKQAKRIQPKWNGWGRNSVAVLATQDPCDALIRATVPNPKRAGTKIFFIGVGTRTYGDFGGWRNPFFSTDSCNIAGIREGYEQKSKVRSEKAKGRETRGGRPVVSSRWEDQLYKQSQFRAGQREV